MGVRTAERMTGVSVLMVSLRRRDGFHYSAKEERRLWWREKPWGRNAAPRRVMLIRSSFGCARLGFIRAGAIKPRHGNAEQAEIHGELRSMMNKMVEHHSPNARHARHGKNLLAAGKQLPVLHHFRIAHVGKRRARGGGFFVESGEQFLAVADFRRFEARTIYRRVIELL